MQVKIKVQISKVANKVKNDANQMQILHFQHQEQATDG